MKNISRSIRGAEAYAHAIKNQKAFDDFYYDLMGLNAKEFCGLPRPTKWASLPRSSLWVMKVISKTVVVIWVYVVFYIFIVAQFIRIISTRLGGDVYSPDMAGKSINLLVCDRSCEVISQVKNGESDFWLKVPLANLMGNELLKLDRPVINASHVLSFSELLACLLGAVRAHQKIVEKYGSTIGMQTYNSLEWMITWWALYKLMPSRITTSEHHDRWAVLADSYCTEVASVDSCELVLAQHGQEYESTYLKIKQLTSPDGLPYKMKNIRKLYVYSENQAEIFRNNIIDQSRLLLFEIQIEIQRVRLNLVEVDYAGPSVLIVGHRVCEDLHIRIFQFLIERGSFNIYYKPHPTAKASAKTKSVGWFFISGHDFFPRVDYLISYPSTLVEEYRVEGIHAVLHGINQPLEDGDLIEKLNVMIAGMGIKSAAVQ